MRFGFNAAVLAFALAAAGGAQAGTYVVDASANSSTNGVGLASISLTAGELFTVSSSTDDLWSAGPGPRAADGDGLIETRFATATDDSGSPVGSLIESPFPDWTQNGYSAPYVSLVGEINGVYQELGANFSGAAWGTGVLNLYFWDENSFDNVGAITFEIDPVRSTGGGVPEPASWALMILGFGAAGAMVRARRQATA
jgi:hypothetical protein